MKPDNTSKYAANRFSIAPMLDWADFIVGKGF